MKKFVTALIPFLMLGVVALAQSGNYINGSGFTFVGQLGSTPPLWTLFLNHATFPPILSMTDAGNTTIPLISINPTTHVAGTIGNCQSKASPAVCGSAHAGMSAVPTGSNPTLVVDTSAVTTLSEILVTPDESLGSALSATCNSTITTQAPIVVTARSPGTSFTVEVDATVATNPVCFSWQIIN